MFALEGASMRSLLMRLQRKKRDWIGGHENTVFAPNSR